MTNVKLQVTENYPIYREYKTRPPKLLRIEKRSYVQENISHDTDQAYLYANRFIAECREHEKHDQNYRCWIEHLGVECF